MGVDDSNRVQADFWAAAGSMWTADRDRFDRQVDHHGRAAIDALAPARGERVIDIGCGAGSTTLAIAEAVGPEGHVHGLDISPTMIEGATAFAAGRGVTNATFTVGDAMVEPFDSDTDALFSRFGVMFFSDATAGFANMLTALRPGGRFGLHLLAVASGERLGLDATSHCRRVRRHTFRRRLDGAWTVLSR